jgi:hypothetical protein
MIGVPDLIFFGIRTAVKLAQTGREIYKENTIRNATTVPLPEALNNERGNALGYAQALRNGSVQDKEKFNRYFKEAFDNDDTALVVDVYLGLLSQGQIEGKSLEVQDLAALAVIQQWDKSADPLPSPLQRVAGSLVNIAVDYYTNVPGALDDNSKRGKTLKSFLQGLNQVQFDEARLDSIVITLFSAGVEVLSEHPEIYSDEDDTLLQAIGSGVAGELKTRLEKLEGPNALDREDRLKKIGAVVLQGLLNGSMRSLIDNPEALSITDAAQQKLVQGVGAAFLDILDKPDGKLGDGLRLLASTGGLEKIVHAALQVTAENPEIFKIKDVAVRTWLSETISDLYALYPEPGDLFEPELFGNIAYLVLDNGIDDLDALLLEDVEPGRKAFLKEVAGGLLLSLAQPPTDGQPARWKFSLSRTDFNNVFAIVFDALRSHPEWLLKNPRHRKRAADALPFIVDFLGILGDKSDGAVFKALLRGEKLGPLLAAILSSGIVEDLTDAGEQYIDAAVVAGSIDKIIDRLRENGISGIDHVLGYELMFDLLLAIKKSKVVDRLLDSASEEFGPALTALVDVVTDLRKGDLLSVVKWCMRFRLKLMRPSISAVWGPRKNRTIIPSGHQCPI